MRKMCLVLCAVMLVSFAGCKEETVAKADDSENDMAPEVSVVMPADESQESSAAEETEHKPSENGYYANKSTKKFHLPSCRYAGQIKNENLYITDNRDELISAGYSPCKNCDP